MDAASAKYPRPATSSTRDGREASRLLRDLVAGRGDIAAGNLTVTEARRTIVDFSRPILTGVREVIVTGPEGPKLKTMADLAGARVFVTAGTSYAAPVLYVASIYKYYVGYKLAEERVRSRIPFKNSEVASDTRDPSGIPQGG